jgi:dGTPase
LYEIQPAHSEDIKNSKQPVVAFSEKLTPRIRELREFLFARMYRHYKVNRMASKAKRVIGELFDLFMEEPSVLPDEWRFLGKRNVKSNQARLIADYIAGMTDRYALLEYDRLFDFKAKI